jgi:lycopene cyclase domain-containing protein
MMRWEYLLSGIVGCAVVVALDQALNTRLLRRRRFWAYLGIMVCCQLVFDGYLTARPVTLYDPCCYLGPRLPLLNMPIEEFPFGLALVGLVAVLWEWAGMWANGRTGERTNRGTGEQENGR